MASAAPVHQLSVTQRQASNAAEQVGAECSRTSVAAPSLTALLLLLPLLGLVAALHVALGVAAILHPAEVAYHEAVVYDHALRVWRGEPLYQDFFQPPYSVAPYTPLYYVAGAWLREIAGPGYGPGRALSQVAGLSSAVLVGLLAAERAQSRKAGVIAALLFLALGLPGVYPWSARYKGDVLGVALSLGAVATLRLGAPTWRRLTGVAILLTLAFLTKQTFVAAAIAGVVWLWQQDVRKALVLGISVGGAVLLVGLLAELQTGALFLNTVASNVNPASVDVLVANLGILAAFFGAPILIAAWAAGHASSLQKARGDLLLLYWLAAWLPLVGLAKVGSDYNYWIELAAVSCVLVGAYLARRPTSSWGHRSLAAARVALILNLTWVLVWVSTSAYQRRDAIWPSAAWRTEYRQLVDLVRAEPRTVLADPLDVVSRAERGIAYEPIIFGILFDQGRFDPTPLVEDVCAGRIGLLVLNYPLGNAVRSFNEQTLWPPALLQALQDRMVPAERLAGHTVYRSRGPSSTSVCGSRMDSRPDPP